MSLLELLFGRPLATSEERGEQIGVWKGIPIFGLDALSSAAYGPEAALTLLIPLGVAGLTYALPITFSIIALLLIVFLSYRQTIAAYPGGGGSYTVARENLGTLPGLVAASALMIDYVLTAAVGISAGIGALTSAVPSLQSKTLLLCLLALLVLTVVNLRGLQEAGGVFIVPTYLFLGTLFVTIALGFVKTLLAGGHPAALVPPPHARSAAAATAGVWLLLKAFSSGCTAMTGVEAVSNGVRAFREPVVPTAQRTLAATILSLVILLSGIAFLVRAYGIVATDPSAGNYRSILSMLIEAVAGRGWFYYVSMLSILLVLIFSANTAFADFPRVCRAIAEDRFLPTSLAIRGRRLVYTEGIVVLAVLTAILLIGFGGVTDRLIPLYAVGAFLAFTLSQAGMVAHWRSRGPRRYAFLNGLGALATGATVLVVVVAKFTQGAWITVLAIPCLLALMYWVRRHYDQVAKEIAVNTAEPLNLETLEEPIVVIPYLFWSCLADRAFRVALTMSKTVKCVHVAEEEESADVRKNFAECVEAPIKAAGLPAPELVLLFSPYRLVVSPIVDYVLKLSQQAPNRRIVAVVPELVERHWYGYFLHNQRAAVMKALFLWKGNDQISVLNIPWYLKQ